MHGWMKISRGLPPCVLAYIIGETTNGLQERSNKMKKRFLALLLAVSMVVPCIPVSAKELGDYYYTNSSCGLSSSDYKWSYTKDKYGDIDKVTTSNTEKASVKAGIKKTDSDKTKVTKILKYLNKRMSWNKKNTSMKNVMSNLAKGKNVKGNSDVYAKSFYMLCAFNGLQVRIRKGNTYEGKTKTTQSWNIVKVSGKWYWVDPYRYDLKKGKKYGMTKTLWTDHMRRKGYQIQEQWGLLGDDGKVYYFIANKNKKTYTSLYDTVSGWELYDWWNDTSKDVTELYWYFRDYKETLNNLYAKKKQAIKDREEQAKAEAERKKKEEEAKALQNEFYSLRNQIIYNIEAINNAYSEYSGGITDSIDWEWICRLYNEALELEQKTKELRLKNSSLEYDVYLPFDNYDIENNVYSIVREFITAYLDNGDDGVRELEAKLEQARLTEEEKTRIEEAKKEMKSYIEKELNEYPKSKSTIKYWMEDFIRFEAKTATLKDFRNYFDELYTDEMEVSVAMDDIRLSYSTAGSGFYSSLTQTLIERSYTYDTVHKVAQEYRQYDKTYSGYFND